MDILNIQSVQGKRTAIITLNYRLHEDTLSMKLKVKRYSGNKLEDTSK
jgi:hypothetical protein